MNVTSKISEEIAPLFKFATDQNFSLEISCWNDSTDLQVRTCLVYQSCVSCNVKRFNIDELPNLPIGTDLYFCKPCSRKCIEVVKKYDSASLEEKTILNDLWNNNLFGRRGEITVIPTAKIA